MTFDPKVAAGYQEELDHLDGKLIAAIMALEETMRALKIDLPIYSAASMRRSRIMWRLHEGKMRILAPMKGESGKVVPLTEVPRWMRADLIARCLTDLFDAIAPTYEWEISRTERAVGTTNTLIEAIRGHALSPALAEKKR
jgi:hypothetical protein